MSKIAVIGTGYVGLVAGTCLADFGLEVICVDNDNKKIDNLNKGVLPIFEPGLEDLVERNTYYKRLKFTTDIKEAVEVSDIIFIAVGTPPEEDGSADLRYVMAVARDIATYMNGYKLIVDKSTVPIGTGQKVKAVVKEVLEMRGIDFEFDVVSNPEFLREGSALYDFTHPDRIVIGVESEKAEKLMREVYRVLYLNETPCIVTNIKTAEMIKYACNAFLAMKITYINEVANLCEKVGADVHAVAKAMGKDGRISPKFLHPGPGYGGSCFPKDTQALVNIGREYGSPVSLVETTVEANERQKLMMVDKVKNAMGELKGKTIAVLGITFKPKTDDMRDAPSLTILPKLKEYGANIRVFDPEGETEGRWRLQNLQDSVVFCHDEYDAANGADAIIILTEWHVFRNMNIQRLKDSMKDIFFFDLRNIYERNLIEGYGLKYEAVGR